MSDVVLCKLSIYKRCDDAEDFGRAAAGAKIVFVVEVAAADYVFNAFFLRDILENPIQVTFAVKTPVGLVGRIFCVA